MKRKLLTFFVTLLSLCAVAFTLTACGGQNPAPHECVFDSSWTHDNLKHYHKCTDPTCNKIQDEGSHDWGAGIITKRPSKTENGVRTYTCSTCERQKTAPVAFTAPTAAETVVARQAAATDNYEGYDFKFALVGDFSVLGLSTSLEGIYQGKYRYDETTGQEQFQRTSSGELFFDSTVYSYTKNSQKIKLVADEDGVIKKSSVIRSQEEDTFFISKIIVGLVNIIQASNINDIRIADTSSKYDFDTSLNFGSNVPYLSKITSLFSNFGTKVAFKNVSFTNPAAIPFSFSIDENNKLEDFNLQLQINVKLKGIKAGVTVSYEQKASSTPIAIPQANDLFVDSTKIESTLSKINTAINDVKASEDYSLDVYARNELDPAWNKLAIVDYYKARMYKNTDNDNVWFNHSYEYKAHHEEDGAEKYKYTLGNIEDGSTHLISRKGKNQVTSVPNVSADTQFDYLTNPFFFTTSNVDCIKQVVDGTTTTYSIHLNNESALSIQNKILDYINSNDAEDVSDVNNYINSSVNIKDAEFIVVFENGVLKDVKIKTDIKYNPIDGDYTDYNVTLTNELELNINDKLSKAEDYFAPASTGSVVGMGSFTYYIL